MAIRTFLKTISDTVGEYASNPAQYKENKRSCSTCNGSGKCKACNGNSGVTKGFLIFFGICSIICALVLPWYSESLGSGFLVFLFFAGLAIALLAIPVCKACDSTGQCANCNGSGYTTSRTQIGGINLKDAYKKSSQRNNEIEKKDEIDSYFS